MSFRRCRVWSRKVSLSRLGRVSVVLSKSLSKAQCRNVLSMKGLLLVKGILVVLKHIPKCRSKKRCIGRCKKLRSRARPNGLLRIRLSSELVGIGLGRGVRSCRYLWVQSNRPVPFLRKQWASKGRSGRLRATVRSRLLLFLRR